MGLAEIECEMARQALIAAVTDAGAVETRRTTINQGLVGAVLNALDKGIPDDEIRAVLLEHGGTAVLRAAINESPNLLPEPHRGALRRLLPQNTQATPASRGVCDDD